MDWSQRPGADEEGRGHCGGGRVGRGEGGQTEMYYHCKLKHCNYSLKEKLTLRADERQASDQPGRLQRSCDPRHHRVAVRGS